jgi:hypothetical protein
VRRYEVPQSFPEFRSCQVTDAIQILGIVQNAVYTRRHPAAFGGIANGDYI